MRRSTLVLLAIVVAGLFALYLWQDRAERVRAQDEDLPLFEGLDAATVTAVRIESTERDTHVRAERGADGRWKLVDPVAVAADTALFDHLVSSALSRRGSVVPASEGDARSLGFEPPRAILELESASNGAARRQRVEIGALDLDGDRVYVRVRGRILRTLRDLDTTLARHVDDYKSREVLQLDAREVVEAHRTGSAAFQHGETPPRLDLDAWVDGEQWRATAPVKAALDPVAMALWVQGATRLEAARHVQDGAAAPGDYGLDPPELSIELVTARDARETLHCGRPEHAPGRKWFARLAGQPSIWAVDENAVRLLAAPIDSLLDHRLVRRRSGAIDGITLRTDDRELLVARHGREWNVSEKRGHGDFTFPRRAETARVDDLIGRLEAVEFAGFVFDRAFEPSAGGGTLSVQSGDDVQAGTIGARFTSESGAVALQFQRSGDSVVALVDTSLADLVRIPMEELLSLKLLDILEIDQASLRISGLGAERRYVRGKGGVWSAPDLAVRAQELDAVLDPLLFLRAEKHRPHGASDPLVDPITIEFTSRADARTAYTIGLTAPGDGAAPQVEVDIEGRRALLARKDQGLHAKLAALLK